MRLASATLLLGIAFTGCVKKPDQRIAAAKCQMALMSKYPDDVAADPLDRTRIASDADTYAEACMSAAGFERIKSKQCSFSLDGPQMIKSDCYQSM